jgi:hypothetical protein
MIEASIRFRRQRRGRSTGGFVMDVRRDRGGSAFGRRTEVRPQVVGSKALVDLRDRTPARPSVVQRVPEGVRRELETFTWDVGAAQRPSSGTRPELQCESKRALVEGA